MFSTLTRNWQELVDYWGSTSLKGFCELESSASNISLSTYDGSLVSLIVLEGRSQVTGGAELREIVNHLNAKIAGFLKQKHHSIECFFCSDPSKAQDMVRDQLNLARTAADNMQLDISDILNEREKMLPRDLRHEVNAIAVWTRPTALTKTDTKEVKRATNEATAADARAAKVHSTLLSIHEAFVNQLHATLSDTTVTMYCHIADKHEFSRIVRGSVYTEEQVEAWNPRLPGDKIDTRESGFKGNLVSLIPDPLNEQIFNRSDNFEVSSSFCRIGGRVYSALDMELPPNQINDFHSLLLSVLKAEFSMPFRTSFLLGGDGLAAFGSKSLLATFLALTGAKNRRIVQAFDHLREREENGETFVALKASFATWAQVGQEDILRSRVERLRASLRGWGNLETTDLSGDPMEAILGSTVAMRPSKIGPGAAAPLGDALHMLPFGRPAGPFKDGTMILRSPDGKPVPFKIGSSEQTAWVYLIYAPMGRGKSVFVSTMVLDHVLTLQGRINASLPRVGIIDIGESSRGVVELIRDGLPAERKHEAVFVKMQEGENHRINLLDTSLGLRYPLSQQRQLQKNILGIICANPEGKSYDGMMDLISRVINEAYRAKDDKAGQPNLYSRNIDFAVDDMLTRAAITLPEEPTWWDVVDALFNAQQYHHAKLAQRHAVPSLVDISAASNSSKIQDEFANTHIVSTGEPLIAAFQRIITSAAEEYPALAGPTTFDIGEARVIAMDLEEVVPGATESGAAKTGVMMLLARHVIASDWFLRPAHFDNAPDMYRSYHKAKAEQIMESKRFLLWDEKQRSAGISHVDDQLSFDVREGRKAGLMIAISSQRYKDFSLDILNLSTCQIILGSGDEERQEIIDLFSLRGAEAEVLKRALNGPGPTGAPLLMLAQLKTKPQLRQFLYNKIGPIELWAFNTTMEDRHLRETLSNMIGRRQARELLAKRFPNGSAQAILEEKKRELQASRANLSSEEASEAAAAAFAKQLIQSYETVH